MKTLFNLSILLIITFISTGYKSLALNDCSGKGTLGGSCNTNCSAGYHGVCSGGFFGADCECVKDGTSPSGPANPIVTGQQFTDAGSFATFLHNSASGSLQAMESTVATAASSAATGNWSTYWSASATFFSQFNSLSSGDKAAINAWRFTHGYTDPL